MERHNSADKIRDVINSTVTPILLAVVGYFGVQTMHEINATLVNLQIGQSAANERLAKIETKMQVSEGANSDLEAGLRRLNDRVEALDRRVSVMEAQKAR